MKTIKILFLSALSLACMSVYAQEPSKESIENAVKESKATWNTVFDSVKDKYAEEGPARLEADFIVEKRVIEAVLNVKLDVAVNTMSISKALAEATGEYTKLAKKYYELLYNAIETEAERSALKESEKSFEAFVAKSTALDNSLFSVERVGTFGNAFEANTAQMNLYKNRADQLFSYYITF